ncbi:phosphotransferase family protein [Embleya sp. NBC_00896]|uniref:phosphotransferase family protein n=1 Tax=Embleya sp. NBC_00896 TaxID=2975961 RepID=UPI0038705E36|nr:aminoglycoside phosphotransferase family protein [Embleya sp. NBC_00896]
MDAVTESITKNRQADGALRAMVARSFGPGQIPDGEGWAEELGHGWFNVAYKIRLRDGRPVVLKIAPPAAVEVMTYETDMMRTEVHALRLVAEHTDVPVPAVLHIDDTRELCDADYFFMEFVDGDNLGVVGADLAPELYRAYQVARGAANRALNGIKGDHFGPLLGEATGGTWREVFTGIVDDVLADGARRGVDLGWDYELIRRTVRDNAHSLDEVTEPAFVEWDLWDPNVMVRDGRITGILDHERALYGDPLMEAGFVAVEMGELPGDLPGFLRGYGKDTFTDTERLRRRLYNLHLMLIMVIETVYRGHTTSAQYDFARGGLTRVMESLGHGK